MDDQINVKLSEDDKGKLEEIADRESRSMQAQVRYWIRTHYKEVMT